MLAVPLIKQHKEQVGLNNHGNKQGYNWKPRQECKQEINTGSHWGPVMFWTPLNSIIWAVEIFEMFFKISSFALHRRKITITHSDHNYCLTVFRVFVQ